MQLLRGIRNALLMSESDAAMDEYLQNYIKRATIQSDILISDARTYFSRNNWFTTDLLPARITDKFNKEKIATKMKYATEEYTSELKSRIARAKSKIEYHMTKEKHIRENIGAAYMFKRVTVNLEPDLHPAKGIGRSCGCEDCLVHRQNRLSSCSKSAMESEIRKSIAKLRKTLAEELDKDIINFRSTVKLHHFD